MKAFRLVEGRREGIPGNGSYKIKQSGPSLVFIVQERFQFRDWKMKIKLESSQVRMVIKSQDLDLEVKK